MERIISKTFHPQQLLYPFLMRYPSLESRLFERIFSCCCPSCNYISLCVANGPCHHARNWL